MGPFQTSCSVQTDSELWWNRGHVRSLHLTSSPFGLAGGSCSWLSWVSCLPSCGWCLQGICSVMWATPFSAWTQSSSTWRSQAAGHQVSLLACKHMHISPCFTETLLKYRRYRVESWDVNKNYFFFLIQVIKKITTSALWTLTSALEIVNGLLFLSRTGVSWMTSVKSKHNQKCFNSAETPCFVFYRKFSIKYEFKHVCLCLTDWHILYAGVI